MKLKISTFILGIFMMSFSLNSSSTVHAQDITDYAKITIDVVKEVVSIHENCDKKLTDGKRKDRCKNGICGTVACISLRPTCNRFDNDGSC